MHHEQAIRSQHCNFQNKNKIAIMWMNESDGLLVAQGFNRMEFSSFPGREDTEDDPPKSRKQQSRDRSLDGDDTGEGFPS